MSARRPAGRTYNRMVRRLTLLLVLFAVLGAAAMPAHAQRCEAPPGTAAVEQYCESIPDEGGSTPSARYAQEPGGPPQTSLGRRLEAQNLNGVELATFVERTRPTGAVRGQSTAQRASLSAPPQGLFAAIGSSVAAGPVTGAGFLIALIAVAALVAGFWAIDRRHPRDDV